MSCGNGHDAHRHSEVAKPVSFRKVLHEIGDDGPDGGWCLPTETSIELAVKPPDKLAGGRLWKRSFGCEFVDASLCAHVRRAPVRLAEVAEISATRSATRGGANSRRPGSIRWGLSRAGLAETSWVILALYYGHIYRKCQAFWPFAWPIFLGASCVALGSHAPGGEIRRCGERLELKTRPSPLE